MAQKKAFVVTKISEVTKNGNRLISLKAEGTVKKTALGTMKTAGAFYIAPVVDDDNCPEVDDEITLDINDFEIVQRSFIGKDNEEITLNWLHAK